jgi:hypothetical protein
VLSVSARFLDAIDAGVNATVSLFDASEVITAAIEIAACRTFRFLRDLEIGQHN